MFDSPSEPPLTLRWTNVPSGIVSMDVMVILFCERSISGTLWGPLRLS